MKIVSSLLLATLLAGCATNPVSIAKTNEQRAYAVYGQYVIVEEQAAEFICGPATADDACPGNPAVPDNVREKVKRADAMAAPVVQSLLGVLDQVNAMHKQLTSCDAQPDPANCKLTVQGTLRVANANLINWINQLLPLVAQLKTAVGR